MHESTKIVLEHIKVPRSEKKCIK